MTIYNRRPSSSTYRKIYEQAFGKIPKDEQGRSYEIHHIDGNPNNNALDNLLCLSIQEHYDLHYAQGDYFACTKIAQKLKFSQTELSELYRTAAIKQMSDKAVRDNIGQKNSIIQKKLVEQGIHHLLSGEIQRQTNLKRIEEGTHNFSSNFTQSLLDEGRHATQQSWICSNCYKSGKNATNYARWHGDNCKSVNPTGHFYRTQHIRSLNKN